MENNILTHCLKKLESYEIINDPQKRVNLDKMQKKFSIKSYGLEFELYDKKYELNDATESLSIVPRGDAFIVWDNYNLPIIKSDFNNIIKNIDSVSFVSNVFYIYATNFSWLLELHHDGSKRLVFENN